MQKRRQIVTVENVVAENQGRVIAGNELTAADIMMLFPLSTMRAFSRRDLSCLPHISTYLRRIGERPAYQRAMAKGDPEMSPMLA